VQLQEMFEADVVVTLLTADVETTPHVPLQLTVKGKRLASSPPSIILKKLQRLG
jgi:hypothetical protein